MKRSSVSKGFSHVSPENRQKTADLKLTGLPINFGGNPPDPVTFLQALATHFGVALHDLTNGLTGPTD